MILKKQHTLNGMLTLNNDLGEITDSLIKKLKFKQKTIQASQKKLGKKHVSFGQEEILNELEQEIALNE